VNLVVSVQIVNVSGDKVAIITAAMTNLGFFNSAQEFLDGDVEGVLMSFQWFNSVINAKRG